MITNPRYAGLRVHQGEVVGDAGWPAILVRTLWANVAGEFSKPMFGFELWEASARLPAVVVVGGRRVGQSGTGQHGQCLVADSSFNVVSLHCDTTAAVCARVGWHM